MKAISSPPPLPRLVLRVGALGNRMFGRDNGIDEPPEALETEAGRACKDVLRELQSTLTEIHQAEIGTAQTAGRSFPEIKHKRRFWREKQFCLLSGKSDIWGWHSRAGRLASVFADKQPLIEVLSGEASGGDTIVKKQAIALNLPGNVNTSLPEFKHVPIVVQELQQPVPNDAFIVGTIPPRLPDAPPPLSRHDARPRAESARRRALGFRAQSEAVRHHSDLLIAVWDPDAGGKSAGTAESVAFALREHLPVIAVRVVGVDQSHIDFLRSPEDLRKPPGSLGWKDQLKLHLVQTLAFPEPPRGQVGSKGHHFSSYHPRLAFHAFVSGDKFPVPWPGKLRQEWNALGRKKNAREPSEPGADFAHYYESAKSRASEMSKLFGDAHRGGIFVSYSLGALAVLFALFGNLVGSWQWSNWWIVLAGGGELLALVFLFALWRASRFQDWHEAYTDARILAEALRSMKHLGPLGVHTPLPKLPPHLADIPHTGDGLPLAHDPRHLWSVWYFRALVRQAPIRLDRSLLVPHDSKCDELTEKWIGSPSVKEPMLGSQMHYHREAAQRNHHVTHWIENLTAGAFILVLVATAMHFLDLWSGVWRAGKEHHTWEKLLHDACFIVGVGVPAALAALTGFLSQIEAIRLQKRSESMIKLLAERYRVLSSFRTDNPNSVEARWLFPIEAAATAGLMVDETAGWALIYKNADIHAG